MARALLRPSGFAREVRSPAAERRLACGGRPSGVVLKYFLDTNTCIYALKGLHPSIGEHLRRLTPADVKIASIVRAELLLGSMKSKQAKRTRAIVEAFLFPFEVVPFDSDAAEHYAASRAALEKKGTPVGPNDLILAATVLSAAGVLVTSNTKEFRRIPRLTTRDWALER